jgi:hypothetical protein
VTPPPAPEPTGVTTGPPAVNWFCARRRDQYPQDNPDYGQLRKLGFGGVMFETGDPDIPGGVAEAHRQGFKAGVWYPPTTSDTPASATAALKDSVGNTPVDAVTLDVEFVGKGFQGTPQWDWNTQFVADVGVALPGVPLAVGTLPLTGYPADFNYGAYTDAGAEVWVMAYGEKVTDLFDPVQLVSVVHASGVPYSRIGVWLVPVQLPTEVPRLQALGISQIAVFGTDGLTPGVVTAAIPFPAVGAPPVVTTIVAPAALPAVVPPQQTPVERPPVPTIEEPAFVSAPVATAFVNQDTTSGEDPEADAISESQIDAANIPVDETFTVDEPDTTTRVLAGVETTSTGRYPSWCPVSRGGYVKGVSGPISTGLREFELDIGLNHVHGDYATHGHATHSFHYCGLAADIDLERWIFDLIYPWKQHTIELFAGAPWGGLFKYGKQFADPVLYDHHKNHIHLAINLTPKEVAAFSRIPQHFRPAVGAGTVGSTVGAAAPTRPPRANDLDAAWHELMVVFGQTWPRWQRDSAEARGSLADVVR